jgi:hypothetical protein
MENYVHSLKIYDTCRNSKANSQTGRKLVWWAPIGDNEDHRSVATESSANSERGLPQEGMGTVDEEDF